MASVVKPKSQEDALLDSATEYLRGLGWDLLVIGGIAVQQQPGARAHAHELVVRFVGSSPRRTADGEQS